MKKNSDILIKVLSLGIGLAVGIVLIAKVFFELSYDSFYKDIDRVYTINTWVSMQGWKRFRAWKPAPAPHSSSMATPTWTRTATS